MDETKNIEVCTSPRKICRHSHSVEERFHINNLPEDVTLHILSSMPTKHAVQTSILSKHWQRKWNSIYNIDVTDRHIRDEATFFNCMDKLLLSKSIRSCHLSFWREHDLCRMQYWISAALKFNVETFKLFYVHGGIVLSSSLFNRPSLNKLKLKLSCTLQVPAERRFPYLSNLCLDGIKILNESANRRTLVLEFPILKKLKFRVCTWSNVNIVEIHAPEMTKFKSEPSDDGEANGLEIKIFGANLAEFESSGGLQESCTLIDSTVVYASLLKYFKSPDGRLLVKFGFQVRTLLKGFSGLRHFIIAGCLSEAIAISRAGPHLPVYHDMVQLVMRPPGNCTALLELLHAAPSLKLLVIDRIVCDGYSYDYEAEESIPSCVICHLEEVRFNYFSWTDQFHLEKFLLKNGERLKRFCISDYDYMPKDELVEQFSKFPTKSRSLMFVAT